MFDNAIFLAASYAAMSAGLSATVAKVSPTIGPRLRHLFAGTAPIAAVLGMRLTEADSVTLQGMDLFAAGGLVVLGVQDAATKVMSPAAMASRVRRTSVFRALLTALLRS